MSARRLCGRSTTEHLPPTSTCPAGCPCVPVPPQKSDVIMCCGISWEKAAIRCMAAKAGLLHQGKTHKRLQAGGWREACGPGCQVLPRVQSCGRGGSGVGLLLLLLLQQAAVVTYASGTGSGTHPDTTNPSCCKTNLAVFGARNMTFFSHKSILNSLRQIWREYPVGKCLQQGSDAAGGDTQETEKAQPIQITHEYYPYFLPKILITFQANPSRFLHKSG